MSAPECLAIPVPSPSVSWLPESSVSENVVHSIVNDAKVDMMKVSRSTVSSLGVLFNPNRCSGTWFFNYCYPLYNTCASD